MTTIEMAATGAPHQIVIDTRSSDTKKTVWVSITRRLNAHVPDDEAAWDASFARSQDFLARLADEALAERRDGRTELLDPDTL